MMKSLSLASILTVSLSIGVPSVVLSHVGHGDEFQATGGIERVQVNTETDQLLGIVVTPIAPASDGSSSVLIPVSALVDADGKQLVFVQYENFYEPVEVTTGATQGELIEITQGLSVGEKLVTQGSLSLYAESRKTKTTEPTSSPDPLTSSSNEQTDAQEIPDSQDDLGNIVENEEKSQESSKSMLTLMAYVAGAVIALGGGVGAIALLRDNQKPSSVAKRKD